SAAQRRPALRGHGALHGMGLGGIQSPFLDRRRRSPDPGLIALGLSAEHSAMNEAGARHLNRAADSIQERLTNYACALDYGALSPEAIHAGKVRIIDTLGALIGGFSGEPCRIAREVAAHMPQPTGATVIGTRMKTTPDMAA